MQQVSHIFTVINHVNCGKMLIQAIQQYKAKVYFTQKLLWEKELLESRIILTPIVHVGWCSMPKIKKIDVTPPPQILMGRKKPLLFYKQKEDQSKVAYPVCSHFHYAFWINQPYDSDYSSLSLCQHSNTFRSRQQSWFIWIMWMVPYHAVYPRAPFRSTWSRRTNNPELICQVLLDQCRWLEVLRTLQIV